MAITGLFMNGALSVRADGRVQLSAEIALIDDKLGRVGAQNLSPSDPLLESQVRAFLDARMPALSAFAGYEITLPPADEASDTAQPTAPTE